MDDAGEGSRATRRQVLGATAGALAVGALPGRSGAQQASGPTVYVGSNDGTLYAVDADSGEQEWAFTQPSDQVRSSPTVVADLASGDSVGSRVLLGTMGHHGDRGDQGTNPTPANFEVTIEQTTEPVAGERLEVTAGVSNTGDSSGTQTVDLTVSGLGSDSTTVSLDGGNSTEQVLSVSTEEDNDGDYTATVESEDDSAQQTVTVRRPVTYPIGIMDATSPVAGETIEVTVAVENTGDVSGTQTVALEVPGLVTDSVAVSLGGGEYTTQTLSIPTEDGDAGEYTATVTTDDDSDEQDVTVLAPAAFTVEVTDTSTPVAGDPLEVTVDVENTGDTQDTQTLGLDVPGLGSDSTDVSLDAGASTELTLSVPTGEGDAGEYTVTAQTNNDEATATATVSEPAGDGDTGSPSDGTGVGGDDGDTPGDSTSGDGSTDPTDDGNSTGDGGLGTTEMAAVGGGGSLALLPGHTR